MFAAPERIPARVFARIPEKLGIRDRRSIWVDTQMHGAPTPTFLEGPSFDRDGNLFVVDIPWGRIFKITPVGRRQRRGRIRRRAERLEVSQGRARLHRRPSPRHDGVRSAQRKGRAVLRSADVAALQGRERSGLCVQRRHVLHRSGPDRTAGPDRAAVSSAHQRSARLHPRQRAEPERTRAQCRRERRLPRGHARQRDLARAADEGRHREQGRHLHPDVGRRRPGRYGDRSQGNLAICHAGFGAVWVFSAKGEPLYRIDSPEGPFTTNCAYGGADGKQLFITESKSGTVLVADLKVAGRPMYSHT